MEITKIVTGVFLTNTYLLKNGNEVIIIDPAGKAEKLIELISEYNLKAIILTHGHFDHIKAVDQLYKHYHVDVYLNKEDEFLARNHKINTLMGISASISCPVKYIAEGEFKIASFTFETFYAPGHTKGSTLFKIDNHLFVGDVLFKDSVGRCDLYGASEKEMKQSLRIFKDFDEDLIVYPGHGDITNIKRELEHNPFLKNI